MSAQYQIPTIFAAVGNCTLQNGCIQLVELRFMVLGFRSISIRAKDLLDIINAPMFFLNISVIKKLKSKARENLWGPYDIDKYSLL
jgi:hypothetical protein